MGRFSTLFHLIHDISQLDSTGGGAYGERVGLYHNFLAARLFTS